MSLKSFCVPQNTQNRILGSRSSSRGVLTRFIRTTTPSEIFLLTSYIPKVTFCSSKYTKLNFGVEDLFTRNSYKVDKNYHTTSNIFYWHHIPLKSIFVSQNTQNPIFSTEEFFARSSYTVYKNYKSTTPSEIFFVDIVYP